MDTVHFLPSWIPTGNAIYPKWVVTLNDWGFPTNISRGSIYPDPKQDACEKKGCPTVKPGVYPFRYLEFPRTLKREGQKRYPALFLDEVPSRAPNPNNDMKYIIAGAWIHSGGRTTGSEGCLTIDPKNWETFMKNFSQRATGHVAVWEDTIRFGRKILWSR